MTVTYTAVVATSRLFPSNFLRLLARWHGSIYKLVWPDLLLFLFLYCIIALTYRQFLNEDQRRTFEGVVSYCKAQGSLIPLAFVLGFYVSLVMGRWWAQYTAIPWPDAIALRVSASIQGNDDRARAMRRTIMRYVCLCQVIVFTMISPRVKKRFPTYNQIIEAGLLLENEKNIIENLDVAFPYYPKHWMPIVWAASIVNRARRENKIRDDYAVKSIIDELNSFRGSCGFLLYYDWITVSLVYTQVVTLATYAFFLCSVIGQQWIESSDSSVNYVHKFFPFFTVLQFFFYMGWLKVAESLINPFGDDDDDFELNWMIDRNLTISYLIVDEMHQEHPELIKDQYWDEVFPNELPYDDESQRPTIPEASTAKLHTTKTPFIGMEDNIKPYTNEHLRRKFDPLMMLRESSDSYISRSTPDPYRTSKSDVGTSGVTFNDSVDEGHARARSRKRIEPDSDEFSQSGSSLSLEELIEKRNRERRDRLRNRFLKMQTTQRPPSDRYVVTVLRPPSPRISERFPEDNEAEEEQEVESKPDDSNSKHEK